MMLEFNTAAELRAHYVAVRARTNAWPPPKKPWHTPHLIEVRKVLFSRVVVTIQNTPVLIETTAKPCLVGVIKKMICQYYKIGIRDLQGPGRKKTMTDKRHVAVYLARQHTSHTTYTLPRIGQLFGGRDHTTILHSHRKISYQRLWDSKLDAELKEFERRLGVVA